MKERKEGDSMKPITPRQQVILDFIKGFISEKGYAPTVREIGQGIFLTAHSTVCALLDRLEENGYIERIAGKSRSLRVVGQEPVNDSYKFGIAVKALEDIKQMLDMDHSGYQKYQIWKTAFDALSDIQEGESQE
jgi:SOS-response transcriptional repressor LexA